MKMYQIVLSSQKIIANLNLSEMSMKGNVTFNKQNFNIKKKLLIMKHDCYNI